MNWLTHPLGLSRFQTIDEIDRDIEDELEFHIECRIADLRAEGLTYQQAETAARAAFGSQASIQQQCQRINYGNRIWLNRSIAALLTLFAGAVLLLGYQVFQERNRNSLLAAQLEKAKAEYSDVTGSVVDQNGTPVTDADVFIITKTWPNEKYRQQHFVTKTDANGHFSYPNVLPNRKDREVLVTIVKPGYAFQSQWVTQSRDESKSLQQFQFQLAKAQTIELKVLGVDGQPIAHFPIHLVTRMNGADEHFLYPESNRQLQLATDEEGVLEIVWAKLEDELTIEVNNPLTGALEMRDLLLNDPACQLKFEQETTENSY